MAYERLSAVYNKVIGVLFPKGIPPSGLELALAPAGVPFNLDQIPVEEPEALRHYAFSKHGGHPHNGGHNVPIPNSRTQVKHVDLDRKPEGVNAIQYIMELTRLSRDQVAKAIKLWNRRGH